MKRICLFFTLALTMTGCVTKRAAVRHGEEMFKLGEAAGKMAEGIDCLARALKSKCPEDLMACEMRNLDCIASKRDKKK